MQVDDPVAVEILSRSMVVCIATLTRHGRPSLHPIYFVPQHGKIWIGTPDWTAAVRNVKANPRVSLLFNVEQDEHDRRVLRIRGEAQIRTEPQIIRAYGLRVAKKYILTAKGLANWLKHLRQAWLRRYYVAQSHEKGQTCVIEVTPTQVELLSEPKLKRM